jgi:transposase
LYRQAQIYAREGVDLDRATMADWVCTAAGLLRPLVEAIAASILVNPVGCGPDGI